MADHDTSAVTRDSMGSRAIRRAAGVARGASWVWLLAAMHAPWRELGGVVDERLRWLEALLLLAGPGVGYSVASLGREWAADEVGFRPRSWARRALYPPLCGVVPWLVCAHALGWPDGVNLSVVGLTSYAAGLDLALWVLPWLRGDRAADPVRRRDATPWPPSGA